MADPKPRVLGPGLGLEPAPDFVPAFGQRLFQAIQQGSLAPLARPGKSGRKPPAVEDGALVADKFHGAGIMLPD